MKITGEATISARTGVSTYCVREEDRSVSWTISVHDLIRFQEWDDRKEGDRRILIENWLRGENSPYESVMPARPEDVKPSPFSSVVWRRSADLSMLELHAIVARNTLRSFIGRAEVKERKLHLYANPSFGWLGWITVGGTISAWVTTDGEIIEDARINYGQNAPDGTRQPQTWTSVDGKITF